MTEAARPGHLLFALSFLALAAVLLGQINSQTIWADGKELTSQPRFWPGVGLLMMTGFGGLHAVSQWRQVHSGTLAEVLTWVKALEFAGWLMLYVFSVPRLGYLPATLLICGALGWRIGLRRRPQIILSLACGFAVVVLFKVVLRVNIPGGQLYHSLPDPLANVMLTYF